MKYGGSIYKFGDGRRIHAYASVTLPAIIGKKEVLIVTDVVNNDIPLLLSKSAMKRAETVIDFKNDTAIMLGRQINLISTQSGHYAVPLTDNCRILNDMSTNPDTVLYCAHIKHRKTA